MTNRKKFMELLNENFGDIFGDYLSNLVSCSMLRCPNKDQKCSTCPLSGFWSQEYKGCKDDE